MGVHCEISKLVDDTELFLVVKSQDDGKALQKALTKLSESVSKKMADELQRRQVQHIACGGKITSTIFTQC